MHRGFAAHPGGVNHAIFIPDIFRHAEPQALDVFHRTRNIGRDLVKVVETYQRPWRVEIVTPGQTLDVLHVVEEFVREAERILYPHRIANAFGEAIHPTLGTATQRFEIGFSPIDVFRRTHPEGKGRNGSHRSFTQHQIMVDKLFHRPQIEGFLVLGGHNQTQDIDVEFARGFKVGDLNFHIGAAHNIGSRDSIGGKFGRHCSHLLLFYYGLRLKRPSAGSGGHPWKCTRSSSRRTLQSCIPRPRGRCRKISRRQTADADRVRFGY
ncbi:hypothetical protein D3C72_1408070 [compost metagenome]